MEKWSSKNTLYGMIYMFIQENPNFLYMDIFSFCKSKSWNVIPFGETNKELMQISREGYTFYENNRFSIFYNEDKPSVRQKFTITHEIGHIFLFHHFYVPSNILRNSRNKGIWESQADTFAQNVLFPVELAKDLKGHSDSHIANYLGVSRDMVNVRYNNLDEDIFWFNQILK